MKCILSAIICFGLIFTITTDANCQSKFKCGEEYYIITKDSTIYQGKLIKNDGDSLNLSNSHGTLIALSDVESASKVSRYTFAGTILGTFVGTGIGFIIAKDWEERQEDEWMEFHIGEVVGITVAGALIGGLVGGIIGSSITSNQELELEMLPLCSSPSGDIMPIRIGLTYKF